MTYNKKDIKGIDSFRKNYSKLNIQKGLVIAPAEEAYAVGKKDLVIPWDIA